jgi:hypothetical protein
MRIFILIALFIVCGAAGYAQKLPNKQEASIWAPTNLEIDGRPREWNDKFQAYNHSTEIYYTIANDDKNIYLTVQAVSPRIIEKIISGGVTLLIKPLTGKNDIEVIYPILPIAIGHTIIRNSGGMTSAHPPIPGAPTYLTDTLYKPSLLPSDSLKGVANLQLIQNANTIGVKGIGEIEDSEISIYNENGIKAASAFDHSGAYTLELALPLKYITIPSDGSRKLKYTIRVNTRMQKGKHFTIVYSRGGDEDADLDTTTDFSGEYTLAKKP